MVHHPVRHLTMRAAVRSLRMVDKVKAADQKVCQAECQTICQSGADTRSMVVESAPSVDVRCRKRVSSLNSLSNPNKLNRLKVIDRKACRAEEDSLAVRVRWSRVIPNMDHLKALINRAVSEDGNDVVDLVAANLEVADLAVLMAPAIAQVWMATKDRLNKVCKRVINRTEENRLDGNDWRLCVR